MKKMPHVAPIAKARNEATNPLWIITAMLAVFAVAAAAVIAWG